MDRPTILQEWIELSDSPVLHALLTGLMNGIDLSQRAGLSEKIITQHIKGENFKFVIDDKNEEDKEKCVICLEDYEDGDKIGKLDLCVHKFHVQCIKQWLMEKNVCPICRQKALNVTKAENEVVVEGNNEVVDA